MKRSKKTGRFISDINQDDIKLIYNMKKRGAPAWSIANTLVEQKQGSITHRTAYRHIEQLDIKKYENFNENS